MPAGQFLGAHGFTAGVEQRTKADPPDDLLSSLVVMSAKLLYDSHGQDLHWLGDE